MHTGIDIAAPKGYKIRAANSGKVIFSGTKGGYGKSVLVYHGKRPSDNKSISSLDVFILFILELNIFSNTIFLI